MNMQPCLSYMHGVKTHPWCSKNHFNKKENKFEEDEEVEIGFWSKMHMYGLNHCCGSSRDVCSLP